MPAASASPAARLALLTLVALPACREPRYGELPPRDDSGAAPATCPDGWEPDGGVPVAPTRVIAACDEPTGRTYVDVAAAWGLTPPAAPGTDHLRGGVAAVADFDGDGVLDIVFGYSGQPLVHFRGTGARFTPQVITGSDGGGGLSMADLDGDGDLDLVSSGVPAALLTNDAGRFVVGPLDTGARAPFVDAVLGDFDQDGTIDAYVASVGPHGPDPAERGDSILWSVGTSEQTREALALPAAGGLAFDAMALDADADGDLDVYTVNDFGAELGGNVLWRNTPDGFQAAAGCACDLAISGMGIDAADLDGDRLPELLIASTATNHLLQQDGDGAYVDIAQATGADALTGLPTMAWGQVFFDHDDDGRLDIVVAEGDQWDAGTDPALRTTYDAPLHLLVHAGTRDAPAWEDRAEAAGLAGTGSWRAVVPADFDGDGQVDLLVTDVEAPPRLWLAQGCTGNGALEVEAPLHTRVEACIGGERHVAWVTTESGFAAARPPLVRFGTGTHAPPDTVYLVPAASTHSR